MKVVFEGGPLDGMEAELLDGQVKVSSREEVPFDIDADLVADLPAATERPRYRAAYVVFRPVG